MGFLITSLECLVVAQPYASLITNGHKRWEFRSFEAKKTGKIGIAAAHTMPLRTKNVELNRISADLPRGVVLATADLADTFFVTSFDLKNKITRPLEITLVGQKVRTYGEPIGEPVEDVAVVIANKNWDSCVWVLDNVQPLASPIPYQKGSESKRTTWVTVDNSVLPPSKKENKKSKFSVKFCPKCGSTEVFWAQGMPQFWSIWQCKNCNYRGALILEDGNLAEKLQEEWKNK